jgi:Acyl-CoA carboxylase epsilon subunit
MTPSSGEPTRTEPGRPGTASTGMAFTAAAPTGAALFEVVSGDATAEEIAVLTAVLAVLAAAGHQAIVPAVPARGPAALSIWADRSRLLRRPLAHAPAGWRYSARPR